MESASWKAAKAQGKTYQDWSMEFYETPEYKAKIDEIDAV